MILATAARRGAEMNTGLENDSSDGLKNDSRSNFGEDDENMVSSSKGMTARGYASETLSVNSTRDKHLRYRTRVFAAECLSHLPSAVGNNPAHFDLFLARKQPTDGKSSGNWLVLYLQELISLAYQISTIQFENMRPIGVGLLSTIVDKFERSLDPELSGHLLLEQYQAQLVSAVRTALDASSGPVLLEAGLQLATKIMTSGILGSDQTAVKRIFSMISQPLSDFKDIYYPSFAEWVSCKIKVRLLAAHASLKCYTYAFLRRHHSYVPDEYLALLPLFAKNSTVLGKYWIQVLKDYSYICLFLNIKKNWNPFLDGIQSPLVSSKLKSTLEEAWPVILQALALDAVPVMFDVNSKKNVDNIPRNSLISGYSMVELEMEDYRFLWGFGLLVLFQQQHPAAGRLIVPINLSKVRYGEEPTIEETNSPALMLHEIVLPVFQFLSSERFFKAGFLTVDVCQELLQVFSHSVYMDDSWNSLAISVLAQILQNFPENFLESEMFAYLAMELPVAHMFNIFPSTAANSLDSGNMGNLVSPLFNAAKAVVNRFEPKVWMQRKSLVLALLLLGYKCIRESSTELCYSSVMDFLKSANLLLRKLINGNSSDCYLDWRVILGTCLMVITDLTKDCIKGIHLLENKRSDAHKLLQLKLAFSLEETVSLAKLAYEIEYPGDTEGTTCSTLFKICVNNAHSLLNDSNLQVQAIGLQVLKTMVQRSSDPQHCTFLVYFCGELLVEILTLAQTMLKRPMSKESVAIVGECLRFLVLLQTVPKSSDCQRAFMNLLLKAIILVFSATEDDLSQEAADVKTIAVRLVSHLAQIPSSAVHFKDVLLSMPATQRLQLQGLILASVAQDQTASHTKPVTPFEIKLPVPKDFQPPTISAPPIRESKENDLVTSAAITHSDRDGADEEEEDDWDTFQSFSASTSAIGTELKAENATEGSDLDEKPEMETRISGSGDLGVLHSPQSVINVDGIKDEDHQNATEEVISVSEENKNKVEGVLAIQTRDNVFESCADQHDMREEDSMPTTQREEEAVVPSKECAEVNVWEDHQQRKDLLDDTDNTERSTARTSGHTSPDEADVQHEAPKVKESEESIEVMASTAHQPKGDEFESPFGGGSVEIEDTGGNTREENREANEEDTGNMIVAKNASVSLQQDTGDHHLEMPRSQDKSSTKLEDSHGETDEV